MKVRVKICCISNREESAMAIRYGASALGLVSKMPSGPGVISDNLIHNIAAVIPPGVATFLLTSQQSTDAIIHQQKKLRTNAIQICDGLLRGTYDQLRRALPGVSIVQVIHVGGEDSVEEAQSIASNVDAILLDSGNQSLKVKELGGTGRCHDWSISRKICDSVSVPVYLAGGLSAENVVEAIDKVQPFGVDVCSGVRSNNQLDEKKLASFMRAVESYHE